MSPSKRERPRPAHKPPSSSQLQSYVAEHSSFPVAVTAADLGTGQSNVSPTKWYKIGNSSSANGRLTFQSVTPVFHLGGTSAQLVECCQVDDLFLSAQEKGSIVSYVGLLSTSHQVLIRLAAVYATPLKQAGGGYKWMAQMRSHCRLGSCNGAVAPSTHRAAFKLPHQVLLPQLRDSQKARKERGQPRTPASGRKRGAQQAAEELGEADRRLLIRVCLNEVSSHLGPCQSEPLYSRLLVTVHPLHADFQAMQGASEAHPTKWKSSTGAGQQCDGIQYLPQHATEHLRVNKPPQPLAAPIGFGLSGPIRVAANNDGPGKDKKLPPPLPDVHITLSQDWLSAAPQGDVQDIRDAWWKGARTCKKFVKLPLIPFWEGAAGCSSPPRAAARGNKGRATKRARSRRSEPYSDLSEPSDEVDDDDEEEVEREEDNSGCCSIPGSPACTGPGLPEGLSGQAQPDEQQQQQQGVASVRDLTPMPTWFRDPARTVTRCRKRVRVASCSDSPPTPTYPLTATSIPPGDHKPPAPSSQACANNIARAAQALQICGRQPPPAAHGTPMRPAQPCTKDSPPSALTYPLCRGRFSASSRPPAASSPALRSHSTPNPIHTGQGMDCWPVPTPQTYAFHSTSPADSRDVLPRSPPMPRRASQSPQPDTPLLLTPAGPGLGGLTPPGNGGYLANAPDWLQQWSPGSMGKLAPSADPQLGLTETKRLAAEAAPLSLVSEPEDPFRSLARRLFPMDSPSPPRPAGLCVPPLPPRLPGSSPEGSAADPEDDLLLPQFPGLGCELLAHEQPAPVAFKHAQELGAAAPNACSCGPGVEEDPIADLMNACSFMPVDALSLDFTSLL